MKLIDLEQQIFVPITDEALGTSYEVQMTVEEFFAKFFEGFQPETVEAIPVAWIEREIRIRENFSRHPGDSEVISEMLNHWREET